MSSIAGILLLGTVAASMITSVLLLRREHRLAEEGSIHQLRARAYLRALGIAGFGLMDFLTDLGVDIYPAGGIFVALFVLLAARATWRYRLVNLTPELAAEQVLATMQGAVIMTDAADRILFVNRAACEMLRCGEDDLLNREAASLMELHVEEGASAGTGELRKRWRAMDGTAVSVSLSASPYWDLEGKVAGTVYTAMDITPLRATEAELRSLNEVLERRVDERSEALNQRARELELEVAERERAELELRQAIHELRTNKQHLVQSEKMAAMGQLAAGVAHEINNPAGFALSNLETLEEYVEETLTPLARQERLAAAVESGEADRQALEAMMAETLADEALSQLMADWPEMLEETQDGAERIQVEDNGQGIPAEVQARIFEPFYTTKEVGEGTGLGLSIAYSIIQRHRGEIAVDSRVGEGTTFTILLPPAVADEMGSRAA